ncbi:hypothetical protein ACHAXM_004127 [Skeletonema potamos]
MQCEIERVKTSSRAKGLGKGRFFPAYEYRLFIRDTKNDNIHNIPRFPPRKDSVLLVAKNKNGRKNLGAEDNAAVGRLQSNFIGTEFQIFSSPKMVKIGEGRVQPVIVEEESGAITYTANLLGNRPRIMDVCIPKVLEDGTISEEWRHVPDDNTTTGTQHNINLDHDSDGNHGLMVFQNRPPWWNVELGAFVLNFGGRVSVASVKNFQLCERRDQDHIMQFGRIQGRHNFTMDFQHPLTPAQAFAIAISSLQSKISFG